MISCIAVVGPKNNPLHVQPAEEDEYHALKFEYITFLGLDAVENVLLEQKDRRKAKEQTDASEHLDRQFLGITGIPLYRYVMANLTKLLVMVSSVSKPAHAKFLDEIAKLCSQIESIYKRAVSNPFAVPGSALESKQFSEACKNLFRDFNNSNLVVKG